MPRNALAAAALGTVAVVWGGYTYRLAHTSTAWPTVTGTVIRCGLRNASPDDSDVPEARRHKTLDLLYRYRVGDTSYDSWNISYSDDSPLAWLWSSEHDEQ